jgi:hypothetical protein
VEGGGGENRTITVCTRSKVNWPRPYTCSTEIGPFLLKPTTKLLLSYEESVQNLFDDFRCRKELHNNP